MQGQGPLLFSLSKPAILLWDTGEEPVSASCHTPKNHRREGKSQFLRVSLTQSLQHLKKRKFWKPFFRWTHFFPQLATGVLKQKISSHSIRLPWTIPLWGLPSPHQWGFIPNGVNGENRNPGASYGPYVPVWTYYPSSSSMTLLIHPSCLSPQFYVTIETQASRSLLATLYHILFWISFNFTQTTFRKLRLWHLVPSLHGK